jgi:CubicO group peptidase (beta-lactamase class C family)
VNVAATLKPEHVGLSGERLGRITRWMQDLVAQQRYAGLVTLVARRGQVAYLETCGKMDLAGGKDMRTDTVFRIYSMTKPITSTAIMMLYEEGRFQLDDPISRFLPMFKSMRVCVGGMRGKMETVPAAREITFRDLLTHTSGLTYGFMEATPVDAAYRAAQVDFQTQDATLPEMMERLAKIPLLAHPGTEWNYSVSTDVLSALVETISGLPFERFVKQRITDPLGMPDTGFHLHDAAHGRLAANYQPAKGGGLEQIDDPKTSRYLKPRKLNSGGGGMVSTVADYYRFCEMLRRKGEIDGVRLLGRKTVEYMATNHLPGDMAAMGQPRFSESSYEGIGFGLGFSVMLDPAKACVIGSPGEFAWGGAASTAFWIDPKEDMIVILLTQLMPSSTWPIRRELRVLTYQAIID